VLSLSLVVATESGWFDTNIATEVNIKDMKIETKDGNKIYYLGLPLDEQNPFYISVGEETFNSLAIGDVVYVSYRDPINPFREIIIEELKLNPQE
jgi:hypothetical protein